MPGKTKTWLRTAKWTSTRYAFSVCCSKAVELRPPTWDRNASWTQFHLRCLKHILGVKWHYNIPNSEILSLISPACTPYSVRSTWDGSEFVAWMSWTHSQGIIQATGVKKVGRPTLWFMDAWKCDLKVCEIEPKNWEDAASYRNCWRRTVKEGIEKPKQTWNVTRKLKRSKHACSENSSTFPYSTNSSAPCAGGTATRALACKASQDVAPPPGADPHRFPPFYGNRSYHN